MNEPTVSRGKAKAALSALSRGRRDAAKAHITELYPYGIAVNEPRNSAYDRDLVISAVNVLEQTLEEAILTKFTLRSDSDQMLFLDNASPLIPAFYDKCRMAYLLGIIGKKTLYDLSVIRHIRNGFAHTRGHLDLDLPEFHDMLEHLTAPDRCPAIMEGHVNQDGRERFIQTCFQLSMYLAIGHERDETEASAGKFMYARMVTFRQ